MVDIRPADLWAVMDDINVLERAPQKRTLLLGALAGVNVCQTGPAGTGKSLLSREFCRRITGAKFFGKACHALMPADAFLGSVDVPALIKDGEYRLNIANSMPSAHVVFVDEFSRANGPTMDAWLPMLNAGERLAEGADGGMFRTPILFVVMASNFMPAQDDPQFGALVDRITLMQYIEYIKADDNFKDMIRGARARRIADKDKSETLVSVTLEQFKLAQDHVMRVEYSDDFLVDLAKLRRAAKNEGIGISDRAWEELVRVCCSSAWLAGRTECKSTDLAACEDGLWRDEADRATARDLCLPFVSQVLRDAVDRVREAEPHLAKLTEARPLIEGLAIGESAPTETMAMIQAQSRSLHACVDRTVKLMEQAEREQVNVPDLRELMVELEAANGWLKDNFLPTFI